MKLQITIAFIFLTHTLGAFAQQAEKVFFKDKDYYMAVKPLSGNVKGVLVLLRGFRNPEVMLSETNLPDVAAANDMLTILVSTGQKFYADTAMVSRLNEMLVHVMNTWHPDPATFAIGGFEFAGTIALRYTELAKAGQMGIPVVPRAVFGADSPTDLFNFWDRLEGDLKKHSQDAQYSLALMKAEHGDIHGNAATYKALSPFIVKADTTSNERLLKDVGVRLYFDTDIDWQLTNRRNSYYDTNIPDGSEFIKRLLLAGNENAAFISSRPGMRANGVRNPNSYSIIEEMDCIRWIKQSLGIFDPYNWKRPYQITVPADWGHELSAFPPDHAPAIKMKGVEELFFTPGWGKMGGDDYWAYTYVLLLDGKQAPGERQLKEMLTTYYDGLVKRNVDPAVFTPSQVTIDKNYTGTIRMYDYMSRKPIVLNFVVDKKDCPLENKHVLFIKISPKPLDHPVWEKLNEVGDSYRWGN